ncbi:MAG: hypothetical protein COB15_04510 [Flavobacteriales bacterium]|nr:MAG: hypothetical protein COB15_04510 [Flavobacteriales bacterium]
MKYGITSIFIGLLSIIITVGVNVTVAEEFKEMMMKSVQAEEILPIISGIGLTLKVILSLISLTALVLGLIGAKKKSKLSTLGIIVAFIALTIVFLPIWTYMVTYSAFDVNFH